jgi:S1-C subfamily serine protease
MRRFLVIGFFEHVRARSLLAGLAFCLAAPGAKAVVGGAPDPQWERQGVMVVGARGSLCSGIVIAPQAVLTAAHCVSGGGAYRVFHRQGGEPRFTGIATVIRHPGFVADAVRTRKRSIDLALIKLEAPLSGFEPASLSAGAPPRAGAAVTVRGHGLASEQGADTTGTARSVMLDVIEPYGPGKILLWAQGSGAGACHGDSGGAMTERSGHIVAITSWSEGANGTRCGKLTQGILIAPQRGFIDATLGQWGFSATWR